MAVEFATVQMLYNNKQISKDNKVPAGQSFRLVAGVVEIPDVIAFIPFNSTGLLTADGNRFICRKDDTDG